MHISIYVICNSIDVYDLYSVIAYAHYVYVHVHIAYMCMCIYLHVYVPSPACVHEQGLGPI